ncbi:hypothetical protein GCM10009582_27950 [Arthrobacter flavus]
MSVQENIRRLDSQGVPDREIARRLGVSRSSVTKYADQENYSPEPPAPPARNGASVLTGVEHIIEMWLGEDQRRNRKQRHTAKRIFDRLVDEHGFTGTYSPVQRFVKKWTARNRQTGEGFTELVWPAGTAQVDFGQAEGSQFRSRKFVSALHANGLTGSMGRVGACGDNAAMESFFSLLQKNVLNRKRWETRQELRLAIITWIERTYHRRRRQKALGKLTPIEFETINNMVLAA